LVIKEQARVKIKQMGATEIQKIGNFTRQLEHTIKVILFNNLKWYSIKVMVLGLL
jgi:hypothetical protein